MRANERRELLRVTLAQHRRRGDHDRHRGPRHLPERRRRVPDRLDASGTPSGQPLDTVFRIVNEETRQPVENPATRALREGVVVGLANHTVLIREDGGERPIDDSAAPIRDEHGQVSGCVLIFRDVDRAAARCARRRPSQLLTARLLASIVESSGRRHHQQVAGWHHPELERRRRAAVRLHRGRGCRAPHLADHSRRTASRRRTRSSPA